MVEFKISVNEKQRQAYIPKEVVEALGFKWILRPNMKSAVIYPPGVSIEVVRRSVEILLEDLRLQESVEQGATATAEA